MIGGEPSYRVRVFGTRHVGRPGGGSPRSARRSEAAAVPQCGTCSRRPAELSAKQPLLADEDRLRGSIRDVVVANRAVEEERSVVRRIDRSFDVVVASRVARGSDTVALAVR